MWFYIEIIFFTNLILMIAPISRRAKNKITITFSTVLTTCLLFFILGNLEINEYFNLTDCLVYNKLTKIDDDKQNFNYLFTIFDLNFIFMLDNLTIIFCFLVTFLTTVNLILTSNKPGYNSNLYLLSILSLQICLFHTFTSLNLLTFYFFFEITLIPMFLLILLWGTRQRKYHAAYLFFIFTAVGSLFLLLGIFYLYKMTNTLLLTNFNYANLENSAPNFKVATYIWIFFFLGFSFKVPIVPFHLWLPEAHVEAPTTGSIVLAGLLLKIGTFGMLRILFPLLNEITFYFRPIIFILALYSIYHASIIAIRQIDLKKLIAYSSIAHMGFVILGLFSLNFYGYLGSLYIMFSHGIVSGALFLLVGCLYDRYKTKNILSFGGLASFSPLFVIFFFFFTLANMSFPMTSNFIGELLVLISSYEINKFVALIATFSIVLTTIYSIWAFNRISFGNINKQTTIFQDLKKKEFFLLFIMLFLMILFGLKPSLILDKNALLGVTQIII